MEKFCNSSENETVTENDFPNIKTLFCNFCKDSDFCIDGKLCDMDNKLIYWNKKGIDGL